jgi:hypothetical protein
MKLARRLHDRRARLYFGLGTQRRGSRGRVFLKADEGDGGDGGDVAQRADYREFDSDLILDQEADGTLPITSS